jgi:uncharacterized protein (TIGR02001 family)
MEFRRFLVWVIACAVTGLSAAHARADETPADPATVPSPVSVSGTASLLSQYRFRGVSRSNGGVAVLGDLGASLVSGFYGGVTLSSTRPGPAVDFGHAEMDLYVGYDHALGQGSLMLDLGLRGYFYADRSSADLLELSAALHRQIGPIDLRAGFAYAPPQAHLGRNAQSGALRDNSYVFAETRADIPGTPLHVHAHLGHTAGGLDYTGAYTDYRVGLGASHKAIGLDLSLVGTTISQAAASAAPQGGAADPLATWRAARSAGIATLSYQF